MKKVGRAQRQSRRRRKRKTEKVEKWHRERWGHRVAAALLGEWKENREGCRERGESELVGAVPAGKRDTAAALAGFPHRLVVERDTELHGTAFASRELSLGCNPSMAATFVCCQRSRSPPVGTRRLASLLHHSQRHCSAHAPSFARSASEEGMQKNGASCLAAQGCCLVSQLPVQAMSHKGETPCAHRGRLPEESALRRALLAKGSMRTFTVSGEVSCCCWVELLVRLWGRQVRLLCGCCCLGCCGCCCNVRPCLARA